jgi:hypothetical protein
MFHWRFPVTKKEKKKAILPFKEELENIMKSKLHIIKIELHISYMNIISQDTCFYQIPFVTTNAVYYGALTIHKSNSCHKTTAQNDVR